MQRIQVLSEDTINKIAAGEVVERPLSVVKELAENAIDAGSTAITIEIKGGGIDLVRVTDNGGGIAADQVRDAFLPHATSKITKAEDLFSVRSLGFRGEALSSIAAVCQVEVITKTPEALTGIRYRIDGGQEVSLEEVGAPEGTTFIVRNLFFHTPARRKFLKSAVTEGGYITEFVQMLAIGYPEIAVKYVLNGQTKFVTTGSGNRRENIYKVYGRDIADAILTGKASDLGMSMEIYACRPVVARSSREYEIFFVNGHYIKDKILQKALEEAYKPYLMQHKFPFSVLVLNLDPGMADVNVHPRKTEMKFAESATLFEFIRTNVGSVLKQAELIQDGGLNPKEELPLEVPKDTPEPFEVNRMNLRSAAEQARIIREEALYREERTDARIAGAGVREAAPAYGEAARAEDRVYADEGATRAEDRAYAEEGAAPREEVDGGLREAGGLAGIDPEMPAPKQMDLFEEKIISPGNRPYFRIVGQVFKTYWIIEYKERMLLVDQHAAHEKVLYEEFVEKYRNRQVVSQYVSPPLVFTVNGRQEQTLLSFRDAFASMGFEIEHFEGNDYALRAVPSGFMSLRQQDVFLSMLDELSGEAGLEDVGIIHDRLAQMSCKAAVKGNTELSYAEAEELLSRLLSLENPYHCPHGRPTIIEFTKTDLEKKFKRVL